MIAIRLLPFLLTMTFAAASTASTGATVYASPIARDSRIKSSHITSRSSDLILPAIPMITAQTTDIEEEPNTDSYPEQTTDIEEEPNTVSYPEQTTDVEEEPNTDSYPEQTTDSNLSNRPSTDATTTTAKTNVKGVIFGVNDGSGYDDSREFSVKVSDRNGTKKSGKACGLSSL